VTNPDDGTLFNNANPLIDLTLAALQEGVKLVDILRWLRHSYEVSTRFA
jgi:hypothetical protein